MLYNVHDFGAVGDGRHLDTDAIQAAIDACHKGGGGQVLLSGGRVYRSGTLVLHSYVDLHLEMGAILKGSDSLKDYDYFQSGKTVPEEISVPTYEDCSYAGQPTLFFLYAKDCEHVSISGFGKIDGNEKIFYGNVTPWHIDGSFYPRVPLLFLEHVSHLTIKDVTLTNSAFWTTHLVGCSDVLITGIRILNNLKLANCDGIDPDHCQNVRISNCHVETADDCIVFKNTANAMQYGPCENITVTNCTLISTSAAIKFGTESEARFRNVIVSNCAISQSNRGISIMLRDCGCIENVLFSNITIDTRLFSKMHWWGEAEPISITAVKREKQTSVGYVKNIVFDNIHCHGENGIMLYGDESRNINGLVFHRITLQITKKTEWQKNFHDLRPCNLSEPVLTGSLNAIFARNVADVLFRDLRVEIADDVREDVVTEFDVENCEQFVINEKVF